jgi:hypothetical protein
MRARIMLTANGRRWRLMESFDVAIRVIRKALRPIRRWTTKAPTRLVELSYLLRWPARGSTKWLIRSEVSYGGLVTNVPRRRVSALDTRSPEELAFGGMAGGDRMLHHGYGKTYAHYLSAFLDEPRLTVAEFGILRGTGLAIWCDLFPSARVMGFDIDLSHFEENRATLLRRGAFKHNQPELHEYDQLIDNRERLGEILGGQTLDVVIDDGLHSTESIITTWRSVAPHLSRRFVYFIEDYHGLLDQCPGEFAQFDRHSFGMLTVVSSGSH